MTYNTTIPLGKKWMQNRKLRAIVENTFPGYRKHRLYITHNSPMEVTLHGLNWSGGSRSEFVLHDLVSGKSKPVGDNMSAPWVNKDAGRTVPVLPGTVIVEGGTFCGKQATLRIHINTRDCFDLNEGA